MFTPIFSLALVLSVALIVALAAGTRSGGAPLAQEGRGLI